MIHKIVRVCVDTGGKWHLRKCNATADHGILELEFEPLALVMSRFSIQWFYERTDALVRTIDYSSRQFVSVNCIVGPRTIRTACMAYQIRNSWFSNSHSSHCHAWMTLRWLWSVIHKPSILRDEYSKQRSVQRPRSCKNGAVGAQLLASSSNGNSEVSNIHRKLESIWRTYSVGASLSMRELCSWTVHVQYLQLQITQGRAKHLKYIKVMISRTQAKSSSRDPTFSAQTELKPMIAQCTPRKERISDFIGIQSTAGTINNRRYICGTKGRV
jgi:hypothetical protein